MSSRHYSATTDRKPTAPSVSGRPLSDCPYCRSTLVQPQGWRELPDGRLMLELRCPECLVWMMGSFEHVRVAEYDDALVKARQAMTLTHDALVRQNMEELAERFERALDWDLIGADDFARPAS